MSERDHAIMEAHKITASDEYFAARPQLDCNDRRKVYEAGFQCAWTEAQAESAAEIADLTQKLEDARKDAERFAWLDKQLLCADFYYGEDRVPVLVFSWPRHVGIGGNLRMNVDAAIDAAMKDAPYEQA